MFFSTLAHLGSSVLTLTTTIPVLLPFQALEASALPTTSSRSSSTQDDKSPSSSSSFSIFPRNNTTTTTTAANPNIEITIHNNLHTGKPLYVYVTGRPYLASAAGFSANEALLQADGTWDILDAGGSQVPVSVTADVVFRIDPAAGGGNSSSSSSSSSTFTLPSYVASARVYVFEGAPMQWQMVSTSSAGNSSSAGATTSIVQPVVTTPGTPAYDNRWGFVEFTSNADQFFVDVSYVDFVSLGMGIAVVEDGGTGGSSRAGTESVVPGLSATLLGLLDQDDHHTSTYGGVNLTTSSSPYSYSSKRHATALKRRQQDTSNILDSICADLRAQAQKDGHAWDKLCIYSNTTSNTLLRVLSPEDGLQQNIPFASASYYDRYVAAVWARYAAHPLYIDTQGACAGLISCAVDAATDELVCAGAAAGMPRPTTADIWGCNSGAFALDSNSDPVLKAVVPRVCAAFTRSTLLLDQQQGNNTTTNTTTTINQNNTQPGPANTTFYQAPTTNHYARVLHAHEGRRGGGYAFAYDDVGVVGENQEGAIQVKSAQTLGIYVG